LKKILIIHHGVGVGGGLIALLGLIEELKTKHEVRLLCIFDSEAIEYIKKTGVKVYFPKSKFYLKYYNLFIHSEASYFGIISFLRNLKNLLTFLLSKYFFARRELSDLNFEYDIVYLNSTFISDWSLAAKKLGKNTVIHVREPLAKGVFGLRKKVIRNMINKYCDRVIAVSKDNAGRVGLKAKTTVIYDPVVYKDRDAAKGFVSNPKLKYFLYLGGMQRIKGFEQLVQSLPYIDSDIRIYFLGGGFTISKNKFKRLISLIDPYMWRVSTLVSRLNQSEKIINVGLVDNIFDYYNSSMALISPFSKPHASLPVLEAFSVGKPVIVSDVEGMDEIVSVENGVFFVNNNSKNLANKINQVAQLDVDKLKKMSENAKNKYHLIIDENPDVNEVIESI
jgi:glycosyltransferase involved in cell wall biosynthesis